MKAGLALLAATLLSGSTLVVVDWLAPVDLEPRTRTQVVVDNRGEPLRRFADEVGVWRYPTNVSRVSPNYLDVLAGAP